MQRSDPHSIRRIIQDNSLGLACLAFFLLFLFAQSVTGWHAQNDDHESHGSPPVSYLTYLGDGGFAEATFENWESEFLQMASLLVLTVFLVQKGSAESKSDDDSRDEDPNEHRSDPGAPAPVRRGGLVLLVYENSLLIVFVVLFLLSMIGHAIGGAAQFNEEQQLHGETTISAIRFATTSEYWFQSFQNWQSEFLAMFALIVLSVVLRQRGSSQSKRVAAPHAETGD